MRDINRIDIFTEKLNKLWKQNPDLRFFQLIHAIKYGYDDVFYMEDDYALSLIEDLTE